MTAGHPRFTQAILTLVCVLLALVVANMFWTARVAQTQADQRCASIQQVASIPVPTPVAGNPSRQWEAQYEAIQHTRARELGCKTGGKP